MLLTEVDLQLPMPSRSIPWLYSCLCTSVSEDCTKLHGTVSFKQEWGSFLGFFLHHPLWCQLILTMMPLAAGLMVCGSCEGIKSLKSYFWKKKKRTVVGCPTIGPAWHTVYWTQAFGSCYSGALQCDDFMVAFVQQILLCQTWIYICSDPLV